MPVRSPLFCHVTSSPSAMHTIWAYSWWHPCLLTLLLLHQMSLGVLDWLMSCHLSGTSLARKVLLPTLVLASPSPLGVVSALVGISPATFVLINIIIFSTALPFKLSWLLKNACCRHQLGNARVDQYHFVWYSIITAVGDCWLQALTPLWGCWRTPKPMMTWRCQCSGASYLLESTPARFSLLLSPTAASLSCFLLGS